MNEQHQQHEQLTAVDVNSFSAAVSSSLFTRLHASASHVSHWKSKRHAECALSDSGLTLTGVDDRRSLHVPLDDMIGATVHQSDATCIVVHCLAKRASNQCISCCGSAGKMQYVRESIELHFTSTSSDAPVAQAVQQWLTTLNASVASTPHTRRLLLIVNPASGTGHAARKCAMLESTLDCTAHCSYRTVHTQYAGHAKEIVANIDLTDREAVDSIVCIGGDGLIFELTNGLMNRLDWRLATQRLSIGVIGGGSGNGVAKTVSACSDSTCSHTIMQQIAVIVKGRTRPLDLLSAQIRPQSSSAAFDELQPLPLLFGCLSMSWGAVSDTDLESEKLRVLGGQRFVVGALVTLAKNRRFNAKLELLDPPVSSASTSLGDFVSVSSSLDLPPLKRYESSSPLASHTHKHRHKCATWSVCRRAEECDNCLSHGQSNEADQLQAYMSHCASQSHIQSSVQHNARSKAQHLAVESFASQRAVSPTTIDVSSPDVDALQISMNGERQQHSQQRLNGSFMSSSTVDMHETSPAQQHQQLLAHSVSLSTDAFTTVPATQSTASNCLTSSSIDAHAHSLHPSLSNAYSTSWRLVPVNEFTFIWSSNVAHCGSDIMLSSYAHCSDGLLDTHYLPRVKRAVHLKWLLGLEKGEHIDSVDASSYTKSKGLRLTPQFNPTKASAAAVAAASSTSASASIADSTSTSSNADTESKSSHITQLVIDGERVPQGAVEIRSWRGILNIICQ